MGYEAGGQGQGCTKQIFAKAQDPTKGYSCLFQATLTVCLYEWVSGRNKKGHSQLP